MGKQNKVRATCHQFEMSQLNTMQRFFIDGNSFSDLDSFYDEVERKFTNGLDWNIGRNLDALNDVMRGGFGTFDYEEPIEIFWSFSDISRNVLGWNIMVEQLENSLKNYHPSNTESITNQLYHAQKEEGQTMFDVIIEIIEGHNHITLILE